MLKQVGLTGIVFSVVMLAVDSAYSQFVLTPVPGLPTVFGGSVAWGDYDNDGRLDFLLSGTDGPTGRPTLLLRAEERASQNRVDPRPLRTSSASLEAP